VPREKIARSQVSGLRSQVSGSRILRRRFLLCLSIACVLGCNGSLIESSASIGNHPTAFSKSSKSYREIRFHGGFVFADRDHVVGIDISDWALSSASEVRTLQSSCECVHASLKELEQGSKKIALVIDIAADAKLSHNASLAVKIEAILMDKSQRSLTFEFTHVAVSAPDRKD